MTNETTNQPTREDPKPARDPYSKPTIRRIDLSDLQWGMGGCASSLGPFAVIEEEKRERRD